MRTLIIDDSESKTSDIRNSLKRLGIFDITEKKARNSALFEISNAEPFDLIVLDMNFPIYDDSGVVADAGKELLYHATRSCRTKDKLTNTKVIICSSNEKIDMDDEHIVGVIHYDSSVMMDGYFKEILNL